MPDYAQAEAFGEPAPGGESGGSLFFAWAAPAESERSDGLSPHV